MRTIKSSNTRRIFIELAVLVAAVLFIWAYFHFKTTRELTDFYEVKQKYDDSIAYYTDRLGKEIATKEVAIIDFNRLKDLDSAKYTELKSRYESRLRQVAGSSTITIKHDTVKVPYPLITQSFDNLGLIEYQDSCLYAGLNFTDSGAYMDYLIAASEISSTILQKDGKIINDVSLLSACGKVGQVKTFIFAPEPKKWYQKPLVVGGIGLGAGLITGIILSK